MTLIKSYKALFGILVVLLIAPTACDKADTGPKMIMVTTLAGSTYGFSEGASTQAKFNYPTDVAIGKDGNIYVTDSFDNRIRRITPAGTVSTLAGSEAGYRDGPVAQAQFSNPHQIASAPDGTLYVIEAGYNRIRKIAPTGIVSTLSANAKGYTDGILTQAQFDSPSSIVVAPDGTLYVADIGNSKIRKISTSGIVSTVAGSS